ncbi:MAG TPA: serine hydrolase domain-containing protein [Bryobacteraceae bacterium]|jgi:CubicO group peptidase (beta-lactamase class C family)|nr:serine hydrolase domain-containing protein [Bryobacteraceae bacterium]
MRSRHLILYLLACIPAFGAQIAAASVDQLAVKALEHSGAPSVSIAVVQSGRIAFEKAYGKARLEPPVAARADMRYSIGSVSKQFLAGTVLLLVQDGKLSLDDHVGKYLSGLTRADEVTIRELLTHTSGYQDYYPQDYVAPFMLKPVSAEHIIDEWARKPLDFDPGTRWQYSNTNYVIAGRIVEKVAGVPFFEFLSRRILQPLGMSSAINRADQSMSPADAAGYTRFALAPLRPAEPEGRGWLFAAGELAMTAHDLALWDISLMEHTLLTPASMEAMTTPARLRNGAPTDYALGVGVTDAGGHPKWQHGGAVSGFVSLNTVWPDRKAAVVVFANEDGSTATGEIARGIAPLLLAEADDPSAAPALAQARKIFDGLLAGKIDRTLLTSDADAFFTPQVLADAEASLKAQGPLESLKQTSVELRGGMTYRHFDLKFKERVLHLSTLAMPGGKLEQYLIQ